MLRRIVLLAAALLASVLVATPVAGYHTTKQLAGHQHDPDEGAVYETIHGHQMPQLPLKDCHHLAVKACEPHREHSHDTWQTNAPMSRLLRCLKSKPHLLPRKCHDWARHQVGCVDDIEKFCPNKPLWKTLHCVEEHHKNLSHACKESVWYQHQFPHDHARLTKPRHHHDPSHELPVEVEDHHLDHDHGYDVDNDEEFSDL
jgi:hypothetical protein